MVLVLSLESYESWNPRIPFLPKVFRKRAQARANPEDNDVKEVKQPFKPERDPGRKSKKKKGLGTPAQWHYRLNRPTRYRHWNTAPVIISMPPSIDLPLDISRTPITTHIAGNVLANTFMLNDRCFTPYTFDRLKEDALTNLSGAKLFSFTDQ